MQAPISGARGTPGAMLQSGASTETPRPRGPSPSRSPGRPEGAPGSLRVSIPSFLPPRCSSPGRGGLAPLPRDPDRHGNWDSVRRQLGSSDMSPSLRLELLQRAAQSWPEDLLAHAPSIAIGREEDRLRLALTVLAQPSIKAEALDVCRLPGRFGLNTATVVARLLPSLVERHGLDLTDCLVKLGMMERKDLALDSAAWRFALHGRPAALAVAKSLLAHYPPDPMRYLLKDTYDPVETVCAALEAPNLSDGDRIEVARLVARRSDCMALIPRICAWSMPQGICKELALSVARHSWCMNLNLRQLVELTGDPMALAMNQQEFRLRHLAAPDRLSAIDLAQSIRARGVGGLDLTRQDQSRLYAHGIRLAGRLDKEQGIPWLALRNALFDTHFNFEVTLMMNRAGESEEAQVKEIAALTHMPPALWSRLMDQVSNMPAEHHRQAFYEWIVTTDCMLGRQPPDVMDRLAPTLEWLGRERYPELRMELTRAFTDGVHVAGAGAVVRFASSRQFHRHHMQAFAVVLSRLYAPEGSALPDSLGTVLSHSRLKEGHRQRAVIRDLTALIGSGGLALQERRRLLECSAVSSGSENHIDGFMRTLKLLSIVARAIESQWIDRVDARSALAHVGSREELEIVLGRLVRRTMPGSGSRGDSTDAELEGNWNRFMTESRWPEMLMAYAHSVKHRIQAARSENSASSDTESDDELDAEAELLRTIDLFADAVVWSADKTEAFATLRYDTSASAHLAAIAENTPVTWAAWREELPAQRIDSSATATATGARSGTVDPMQYLRQRIEQDAHVPAHLYPALRRFFLGTLDLAGAMRSAGPGSEEQRLLQLVDPAGTAGDRARVLHTLIAGMPAGNQFRRDLEDLHGLLFPRPASVVGLRAVDTDNAEDLLLCGTEVAGSCQHVEGELKYNKALMGYVVDGKYRMLAVKGNDGRLVARRMLRLLLDENDQPVLHLERRYANTGIHDGDAVDQALIDLAKKKAAATGCRLLADNAMHASADMGPPCTVRSLDSRAPFEYVDALADVEERSYELVAWPFR